MSFDKQPVLIVADAGGEIGFGHLMRCRELAHQIQRTAGRSALFLVDDDEAVRRLDEVGLQSEWGAFERDARSSRNQVAACDAPRLARNCAFVVLDIFGKRELNPGWRARLARPTVVLDRAEGWAGEADLVVIPGVTYPSDWHLPQMVAGSQTPIYGGVEYIILRDQIRNLSPNASRRDIDVLAYLYDSEERNALRQFGIQNDLCLHVLERPAPDFPNLLSRSRLFLSGFGITFYEALSLGTRPVAWPLSAQHRIDACRFFRALGLPPAIIENQGQLDQLLEYLQLEQANLPVVSDGTSRIVELLERTLVPSTDRRSHE